MYIDKDMYIEKYEPAWLDIIEFQTEDVIMTSSGDPNGFKYEENELPFVPNT